MNRQEFYEITIGEIWTALEKLNRDELLEDRDRLVAWVALEALRRDMRAENCMKCTLPPACDGVAGGVLGLPE